MSNYKRRPIRTYESAVKRLFAVGEDGVWFDPSDGRTMIGIGYAGLPSAVDGVVGLMLDKSKGLAEIDIWDGTFPNKSGEWVDNGDGSWTVTSALGNVDLRHSTITTSGKVYKWRFTIEGSDDLTVYLGNTVPITLGPGSYERIAYADSAWGIFRATVGESATVKDFSCHEILGNHAVQTTTAAKPILREDSEGRRYLEWDLTDDFFNPSLPAAGFNAGKNILFAQSYYLPASQTATWGLGVMATAPWIWSADDGSSSGVTSGGVFQKIWMDGVEIPLASANTRDEQHDIMVGKSSWQFYFDSTGYDYTNPRFGTYNSLTPCWPRDLYEFVLCATDTLSDEDANLLAKRHAAKQGVKL